MVVLANTLSAIALVLETVLNLYFWIVVISCLLSWVNPDPTNPIVRTLRALTEPVFYRIRRAMSFTYVNGLDLSPVVLLLAIQLVETIVVRSLRQYAMGM